MFLYQEDDNHQRLTTDPTIYAPFPPYPMDACLDFFPTVRVSHPRYVAMPSSSVPASCPSDTVCLELWRRSNTTNNWPSSSVRLSVFLESV
jgi:hypothetical protein